MRLFVAVLPPPETLDRLEEFVAPRREDGGPLRWMRLESWHLTLAFMADVGDRHYDRLVENLEESARRRATFDLALTGAGAFPDVAEAKIVWAGVSGDTTELERLATATRSASNRSGCRVDGARFRPHLTLARISAPLNVLRWVRVLDELDGEPWTVSEIALVESQPTGGGRHYRTLETFPLGG